MYAYLFLFTDRDMAALSVVVAQTDRFEEACELIARTAKLSKREAESCRSSCAVAPPSASPASSSSRRTPSTRTCAASTPGVACTPARSSSTWVSARKRSCSP